MDVESAENTAGKPGSEGVEPDRPGAALPITLRRLLPAGDPASADEIIEGLDLGARPGHATGPGGAAARPRVLLNMVSTADGRASIGGRSGPIGKPADRDVFHALRGSVDAVMAGAGTVRTERYGRMIPDRGRRQKRCERGLSEEPIACIVSERVSLPADLPLLSQPQAKVVIVTGSEATLPASAADVHYVRSRRDGLLDLPAALGELSKRYRVRTLLCEGGPHLSLQLIAAGLVDELWLSLSPKLAGGTPPGGEDLRILAGAALEEPVELDLIGVLESESQLFLRYRVLASAPDSVSRETTLRTSLAS